MGRMMQNKSMWGTIHSFNQFFAFLNDGNPLSPGEYGCKESHDFNVLFLGKQMRNTNGVIFNESLLVVLFVFFIQKFFEVAIFHLVNQLQLKDFHLLISFLNIGQ